MTTNGMTLPVTFGFPEQAPLAEKMAALMGAPLGKWETRRFPDGETYVRALSPVASRDAFIVCSLNHPDEKLIPLLYLAGALKTAGATSVGLVAPYLAYMRQDKLFHSGEVVSNRLFANLLETRLDWLVTVDPHLHRVHALQELYSIPANVVAAAPEIAAWLQTAVPDPLLIGPDEESEQWVADVAARAGAPYVVLRKERRGDREVEITSPNLQAYVAKTPVLIDDIISSAHTMAKSIELLPPNMRHRSVCIGVHAVFGPDAYELLQAKGADRIVTCNTIAHASNGIELSAALVNGVIGIRKSLTPTKAESE